MFINPRIQVGSNIDTRATKKTKNKSKHFNLQAILLFINKGMYNFLDSVEYSTITCQRKQHHLLTKDILRLARKLSDGCSCPIFGCGVHGRVVAETKQWFTVKLEFFWSF